MNSVLSKTTNVLVAIAFCSLTACSTHQYNASNQRQQTGESVVLVGTDPAALAFLPAEKKAIHVRSTYQPNLTNTISYEEGRDYLVDLANGWIHRAPQSRIPDFRTNMLHGKEDFDHSKFPGFGNTGYFAFVDYAAAKKPDWPAQPSQEHLLPRSLEKLRQGEALKIVAYGDSITAGGDATKPSLIYWQRWADALQLKYPAAKIEILNGATGGDSTRNGIDRLSEKVISQKPDLVLVAFGMNDHNIGGFGTPIEEFPKNLEKIIGRIRNETASEIILLSTFPPNPKWHYGSHNMAAYARETKKVAETTRCAYVDIYGNWLSFSSRKKPEDLLGNNINHPNDFGHWIYFRVLQQIGF